MQLRGYFRFVLKAFVRITYLLTILLWSAPTHGQKQTVLTHLGPGEGMPITNVRSLELGPNGRIWMATNSGLLGHDGYHFWKIPSADSLRNVFSLVPVGEEGRLLVGTGNGAVWLDEDRGQCQAVDAPLLQAGTVFCTAPDDRQGAWLGVHHNGARGGHVTRIDATGQVQASLPLAQTTARCLMQDAHNSDAVYIGGRNLRHWDSATGVLDTIPTPWISRTVNVIEDLAMQGDSVLLAAHYFYGLHALNLRTGTWTQLNKLRSMKHLRVDDQGVIWVATLDYGVGKIYPDGTQEWIPAGTASLLELPECGVRCTFEDPAGQVWLGLRKGLTVIRPEHQRFSATTSDHEKPLLSAARFTAQGLEAFSEWHKGCFVADTTTHTFVEHHQDFGALNPNKISAHDLVYLPDGRCLMANHLGFLELGETGRDLTLLTDDHPEIYADRFMSGIEVLADNTLAFAKGAGFYVVDVRESSTASTFVPLPEGEEQLLGITSMGTGNLWIFTESHVLQWNRKNGFTAFSPEGYAAWAGTETLWDVACMRDEILLAGTNGHGAFTIDLRTGLIATLPHPELRDQYYLRSMQADGYGNIWGATNVGLLQIHPSGNAEWFDVPQGLPTGQFRRARMTWDVPSGKMTFATRAIAGWWDPKDFRETAPPSPLFTLVSSGDERNWRDASNLAQPLELGPESRSFGFCIGLEGLGSGAPPSCRYRWSIGGKLREWINVQGVWQGYIEELPPGEHSLEVQVGSDLTGWESKVYRFDAVPYWWERRWVQVVLALAFAALVGVLVWFRSNRLRTEERARATLERKAIEERMSALRAQMNPHFLFNSLNSIKSFIINRQEADAVDYLSRFARLMRLVLNHSSEKQVLLSEDLEALRLYIEIEQLRLNPTFTCEWDMAEDVDVDFVEVPPLLIQPFVENAIWHGLSTKQGERVLRLTFRTQGDLLVIAVEDNGIGRQKRAAQQAEQGRGHVSKSVGLNQERIASLSDGSPDSADIRTEDLTDAAGQPAGTRVTLTLPL